MPEKKSTSTPRKDGSVRMANSHGWQYWINAKDVGVLMAQKKPWTMVPDPPDGKHGPTGPPKPANKKE